MSRLQLGKGRLGRRDCILYTNNHVITCRPCPRSNHLRALSLRIQANSALENNAAISTRGLQLTFGGGGSRKQVLAGVDLDVPRGTFHMLLGANGCGKSTTLRVIAGLLSPDAGTFYVDRPFGMVFQNPDHQVVLPTVAADVAFGLGRYNLTSQQVTAAVHHALDRVGLATYYDRPTSSLSGGQKQRVAIAGALAENPRVLLLDELTTFLDARDQRNVLECVRNLVDSKTKKKKSLTTSPSSSILNSSTLSFSSDTEQYNTNTSTTDGDTSNNTKINNLDNPVTALWVTHRLEELEFADGVSIMDGGKVVFNGTPKEALAVMKKMGARI